MDKEDVLILSVLMLVLLLTGNIFFLGILISLLNTIPALGALGLSILAIIDYLTLKFIIKKL